MLRTDIITKMKKLVLDSSVIIKWLNRIDEQDLVAAEKLLDELENNKIAIFEPYLVKFEIPNALLKGKKLSIPEGADALKALSLLPLTYIDFDLDMMVDTYELASNNKITIYDASFITLAASLSCNLVTANPKDQRGTEEARVIPLSEYFA